MKKISGRLYYMRKTMDYLGVALLLSLLYLLWILYQGPLSVPFLKPYIMQALNSDEQQYSMNIGEVNLELVRSIQPIKIIANNVSLRAADDKFSIKAPKLSLSFSVRALLKGIVAPSSVTVENPQVAIFMTYGLEKDKTNEINKKKVQAYVDWFEGFLERFNSDDDIYPESFINEINIKNAEVEFHEVDLGRKWSFKDVKFDFDRNINNLEIGIGGLLDLKDRLATLNLGGKYQTFNNHLVLDFSFADLVLSDLISNLSDNMPKIDVPVDGNVVALIDFDDIMAGKRDLIGSLDAALEDLRFQIKGGAGEVIFNDDSKFNYGIDAFALKGNIDSGLNSVKVSNADFTVGGQKTKLSLDISGYKKYVFERSLEDLKIVFEADIDKFKLDDLSKFWPRYLAEPAWEWCKQNLFGGYAENGKFVFTFGYDEEAKAIDLLSLKGRADVVDSNISYLEGMPVVNNVYGVADFSSSDIDIKVDKGVSDGVIITGGNVRLYDLNKHNNYIDINIKGNSSVNDALRFIDNPPLNYAKEIGINPGALTGDVEIDLGLNFELYQDLSPDEIKVDVKADLQNLKYPDALDGKDLTAEKLFLQVNANGFEVTGNAEFDGIPLKIAFNEFFNDKTYKSKGTLKFVLNDAVKKKLGVNTALLNAPYINGYANVTADLTVLNNNKTTLDVDADLKNAAIDYSFLGFKKAGGVAGDVKAKLELAGSKISKISSFSLHKSDFDLSGDITLDKTGDLKAVNISRIHGPKTSAKAKIEFADKGKKVKINVSGNSYDLTELFAATENKAASGNSKSDDDDWTKVPNTEVFIAVNSLWTNPDTPIKNFAGSVLLKPKIGIDEVHMVGNYGSDKSIKLKLDYVPRPDGEYLLSIDSNNAGSTLRVLRLYDDMTGGILKIEAKRNRNKEFVGHAQIRDFSIHNTPLLAKLLTMASFSGILDLLRGEGLTFSHFDAPFEYKNKVLYIKDAKMFGNVIGFTGSGLYKKASKELDVKGVISPAYSLNSLIGKIPVVGSVLAGKDGTVFAVSYKITGNVHEPKISINPLSVFSPNSVKDLFSAESN